jgi:hypothetical protein
MYCTILYMHGNQYKYLYIDLSYALHCRALLVTNAVVDVCMLYIQMVLLRTRTYMHLLYSILRTPRYPCSAYTTPIRSILIQNAAVEPYNRT